MKPAVFPLAAYDLGSLRAPLQPLGGGYINQTWLIEADRGRFVGQQLNGAVFPDLPGLAHNVEQVLTHLQPQGYPLYLFPDRQGRQHHAAQGRLWRVWPYLSGRSLARVRQTSEAAAAGQAFGAFARQLQGLDPEDLREHLPRFHDLRWRYAQLDEALSHADTARLNAAQPWLVITQRQRTPMLRWQREVADRLPRRVAHYDAKLSNVLLHPEHDAPLAVLDLDTVMPGTPVFDYGDLIRSATCPVPEDSTDLDQVRVHPDWHHALTKAFLAEADFLTDAERAALPRAGRYLALLMGLRFLTDFLQGDRYYRVAHPRHNLDRAANQLTLAQQMEKRN